MDSIDVLDNYKFIYFFTRVVVFFKASYNRLDPLISLYKSKFVQAYNLKLQVCHNDSSFDKCTDSTEGIYVSFSGEDLCVVIDTAASNSTIPNSKDFSW